MLFVSEQGDRFGFSVGEKVDIRVRVEIIPKVKYNLLEDDVLTLIVKKGPSQNSETLLEVSGAAGSNIIPVSKDDTKDLKPGSYTAIIVIDSPQNGFERKFIYPKIPEEDIRESNPYFPIHNFILTPGGGLIR